MPAAMSCCALFHFHPPRPSLLPAALGLLWALILVPMLMLCGGPAAAQLLHVDSALTAENAGAVFPEQGKTRALPLPDDWSRTRPGSNGPVWYRVSFMAPGPADAATLPALQIAHVCATFLVQLNGQLVHSGGRLQAPYTQDCNHPQLITLPSALLRPGLNQLDLKVVGHPLGQVGSRQRAGALSDMTLGPLAELQARQRWQTLVQVTMPQALGATLLLIGGFMFVLGFFNRHESHLAYFGALSVGWALLDARLWLREWPVSHTTTEVMLAALLPLAAWAAVQFPAAVYPLARALDRPRAAVPGGADAADADDRRP